MIRTTRKRILYGVHGYGRGHAARAQAILPHLLNRYEVKVLAGDDAYDQLSREFPVTRIPALRYHHRDDGRRSSWLTIKRNLPAILDQSLGGPIVQMVRSEIERFGADVVLSDSEGWTHRAARQLGRPRISFDHYGMMAFCRLDMPLTGRDRLELAAERWFYRRLVDRPDRAIVVAFYEGQPIRPGVTPVGPLLREAARQTRPSDGDYLMVYFTNAAEHYTPRVEEVLRQLDCPVKIYGPNRDEVVGNLHYRPTANRPFLEDLAASRAVFATAGNQLTSEAIHFNKPLLLMPEEALEQRLNAMFVEHWRIGESIRPQQISGDRLRGFLGRCDEYAANIPAHRRDGLADALAAIESAIAELS